MFNCFFLFTDNIPLFEQNPTTVALDKTSKCCDAGVHVTCSFSEVSADVCVALVLIFSQTRTRIQLSQFDQKNMHASGCISSAKDTERSVAAVLPFNGGNREFVSDTDFVAEFGKGDCLNCNM